MSSASAAYSSRKDVIMRRLLISSLVTLMCAWAAAPAQAQGAFTVEVRGGVNTPTETFVDTDLERGVGLEGTVAFRVMPRVSVYGGWDWNRRSVEDRLFGAEGRLVDAGYVFGVKFTPATSRFSPWLRAGALYNNVELEDANGRAIAETDRVWGWEAGAGIDVPIGGSLRLTPGVRYRRFEPSLGLGSATFESTLAYVVLDVGLAIRF